MRLSIMRELIDDGWLWLTRLWHLDHEARRGRVRYVMLVLVR